jgi:hypothetical protein
MIWMILEANICIVRIKHIFVACLNRKLLFIELLFIVLVDEIDELE